MIADYGANAGQQWFDQTFVPAYQQDRPKAKVTMLYTAWADLGQKRDTVYAAGQGPTWSSPAPANRTPTASWWCPSTTG